MHINQKGFSTLLVAIVVSLIAVAIVYFVFVKEPAEQVDPLLVGNNTIYVSNTKPDVKVNVAFAIFESGGYVVIYDDSEDGSGSIIGNSTILPQGESRGFDIALSRESVDGEALYAMLHFDNGDGVFNFAEDPPIQDGQGNIMSMRFHVFSDTTESGVISL
ncbi:hypothetical protein CL630_00560 [bacterium]|nr:hypothetical protein [bacterium]|tara:strand:- start:3016 stop:3498 length:483 start_codon:yes stop_codon:yes gene_type:complete